jgi:autotransporter-associated beta strand protein
LTKSGLGTLVLGSSGNSYGGPTTIDAGTLKTTAAGAIPSTSPLVIASAAAFDLGGQAQTVGGITLDDGSIVNSAAATALTLGGRAAGVTYSGVGSGSSISGGTLYLAGSGSGGSHTFSIARGQGSADLNILADIADGSGSGQALVKTGSGILQLSGTNSFTGGTQIQAGELVLGGNQAVPAASSVTLSAGTLNLGGYANSTGTLVMQNGLIAGNGSFGAASFNLQGGTLSGSLAGTGALSKTTSGTVTITSSNGYSGGTTLSGGTLSVWADNNLGSTSGALTLNGGTLQVLGTSFTSTTRSVATSANGGAISIADPNNTLTLATQNLAGSGAFAKAGQGTLQLGGSLGSTAITVEDGVLQLTASANQLTGDPALSLWNVATLLLSNHNESVSAVNLTGGTINTGGYTLNLAGSLNYNNSIWPATIEGNLSLGSPAGTFSINQGSSTDVAVAANISGSPAGGLVKTGNGLLTLSGSNTYTGGTTISGGTLQLGNGSSNGSLGPGAVLDSTSGLLSFDAAGTFTFSNAITGSGAVALLGGTTVLTGSDTFSGGTTIYAGTLQIGNGGSSGGLGSGPVTDNGTLSFSRSGLYTVPGAISGSGGLTLLGPGTVVLGASDSYTGRTLISGGALRADPGVGLSSSSGLTLNGGVLESNGNLTFTASIGSSAGDVDWWTTGGGGFSANGGTMTVNLNGGAGAQVTWGTAVTQIRGTLMFGSATANNETDFVNPVNLLSISGTAVSRTVQVTAGLGGDFALISGGLSNSAGTAGLVKTGNGLLVLSGSNSYNGGTQVNAGNIAFSSTSSIPTTGTILLDTPGALNVGGAYSTATGWLNSGAINVNSTGAVAISGTSNESIDMAGPNFNYGSLALGAAAPGATYSGVLTPSGSTYRLGGGGGTLTVAGSLGGAGNSLDIAGGSVVLSGTNSYGGSTTISSGTVQFNSPQALGGSGASLSVASSATVVAGYAISQPGLVGRISPASSANAFTIALDTSSSSALDFSAAGANLTLATLGAIGTQTYGGTLTPSASTYRLGGGGGTLDVTSDLTGNRSLIIDSTGPGDVLLSGTNSFTGLTTVSSGGTLQILRSSAYGGGGLVVAAGADLILGNVLPTSFAPLADDLASSSLASSSLAASGLNGSGLAISSVSADDSSAVLSAASQPAANAVPEPGTLLLLLAATVGGLLWRVRQRFVA